MSLILTPSEAPLSFIFAKLEEEVIKAVLHGCMICIELDANAKLGPDVIKKDPNEKSMNGELLLAIIVRSSMQWNRAL